MNEPSSEDLKSFLNSIPLFSSVDGKTLDGIVPKLEWIELPRGEILFREGDEPQNLYVVVFGRLLASIGPESDRELIGEVTRGEYVGEMGFIQNEPRSATVRALRNSYLVALHRDEFETLIRKHPEQLSQIADLQIDRLQSSLDPEPYQPVSHCYGFVPLSPGVDLDTILGDLTETFPDPSSHVHLRKNDWIERFCSGNEADSFREAEFLNWLNHQEARGRTHPPPVQKRMGSVEPVCDRKCGPTVFGWKRYGRPPSTPPGKTGRPERRNPRPDRPHGPRTPVARRDHPRKHS